MQYFIFDLQRFVKFYTSSKSKTLRSDDITLPGSSITGVVPESVGGTGQTNLTNVVVGKSNTLSTARNISTSLTTTVAASFDGTKDINLGIRGILPVSQGGTGQTVLSAINVGKASSLATARNLQVSLSSSVAASFNGTADVKTIGVQGTLPIKNGGTGLTASPSMLTNLGSTAAANVLTASPRPGVTGTLPVANGGTGQTVISEIRAGKDADGNVISTTYTKKADIIEGIPINKISAGRLVTCSTAAASQEKEVTVDGFTLENGARLNIRWTATNTATYPMLNVSGTGSHYIVYPANTCVSKGYLNASYTFSYVYDAGTYTVTRASGDTVSATGVWRIIGTYNTNTDTKVTQTLTDTVNAEYNMLAMADAAATANKTNTTRFTKKIKMNPSLGRITATSFQGSLTGNADSATRLETGRNINVALDTSTVPANSFDGTSDITVEAQGVLPVAKGGTGQTVLSAITVGKASAADKLTTARNLQVSLNSNTAKSFNGEANVTNIGVQGVLPVANGGTGQTVLSAVTVGKANTLTTARQLQVSLSNTTPSLSTFNGTANVNNIAVQGVLPVANGGTGQTVLTSVTVGKANTLTTARNITANLASTAPGSFNGSAAVTVGSIGILPVEKGGTGVSVLSDLSAGAAATAEQLKTGRNILVNLATTVPANFDGTASVSPGVTGTLPVARGGTGQTVLTAVTVGKANTLTTARQLQVSLSNTTPSLSTFNGTANVNNIAVQGVLPVANGGTGQTVLSSVTVGKANTLTTARALQVSLSSTLAPTFNGTADVKTIGVTGTLPVVKGGTGQTVLSAVTVGKANTLTTARALQVSLSSTGAPTFNGSADVKNIGVTGILPVANGGTGNSTGNAATATKFASAQTVTIGGDVTGSISSQAGWNLNVVRRSCVVGQSGNSNTNPWYKVASYGPVIANDDADISFFVEDTYNRQYFGILKAHIRSNGSSVLTETQCYLLWLAHTGYPLENFVLVLPTTASCTVELWTKVDLNYMSRRFTVLSEGSRTKAITNRWQLYDAQSAGQAADITTEGTRLISTLTGNTTSADKAKQLTTARALQVSLSNTVAASFNGSADVKTIGVTGVLPVAKGGTGQTVLSSVTVGKANTLTTARALQVSLSSTLAPTFNGSADVKTIGVTGTLPVAKGGTGQTVLTSVTVGKANTLTTARQLQVSLSNTVPSLSTFNGTANVNNIAVQGILPVANGGTGQTVLSAVTVGKANTLTTKRNIFGIPFDGSANIGLLGTSSTAAATAVKVVTGLENLDIRANPTRPIFGVRFNDANTAENPKLSINGNEFAIRRFAKVLTTGPDIQFTSGKYGIVLFCPIEINGVKYFDIVEPYSGLSSGNITIGSGHHISLAENAAIGNYFDSLSFSGMRILKPNKTYGSDVVVQAGSNLILGAGEGAIRTYDVASMQANSIPPAGEDIYLVADTGIHFRTNNQNVSPTSELLEFTMDTSGNFQAPNKVIAPTIEGALIGNASTVTKLQTARTLKVSLASTASPSFDGSANVTNIGVAGVLPIANGGTGQTVLSSVTVGKANTLTTARNILVNLASTVAASFNGTASVSPGVTGTLPVAKGGTGQTVLSSVTVGKANTLTTARQLQVSLSNTVPSLSTFNGSANVNKIAVQGILPVANGGTGNSTGAMSQVTAVPIGTTWVQGATSGQALVNSNATNYGALFNAPTKDYRISMSTYPKSNNLVYLLSIIKDNIAANTNIVTKQLTWDAETGILTTAGFSGPLTGNASSATNLQTARALQVSLSSTGAPTFNGSADVKNIGVTGVLPIANGGTGNTMGSAKLVSMVGAQAMGSSLSDPIIIARTASNDRVLFLLNNRSNTGEELEIRIGSGSDGRFIVTHSNNDYTAQNSYPEQMNVLMGINGNATFCNNVSAKSFSGGDLAGGAASLTTARQLQVSLSNTTASLSTFNGSANVNKIAVQGVLPVANGGTGQTVLSAVTVGKANSLTTARALQVSLSSTGSPAFNGSADVKTIGVQGILPVVNGGTGASIAASARTNLGIGNRITWFGTCSTAAATVEKVSAITNFVLATGAEVVITFTVTDSAGSPTLNVNNTGARQIRYEHYALPAGAIRAYRTYSFVYDGSFWQVVGSLLWIE